MTRFSFAKSESNVKQKVHFINLFKVSWTENPTATENTELQLALWCSTEQLFCLTQLNFLTAKLVPLSNKAAMKALLAIPWTKVQDGLSVPKVVQPPPLPGIPELPLSQHSRGLTCQGQFGSRGVELCRTLVRIHAVPQGQV